MTSSTQDTLQRALDYPYNCPATSYVLKETGDTSAWEAPDLSGRTPVLGLGSNRSPAQLMRKYQDLPKPWVLPVQAGWLADFDSVYSAHFTSYGSIAATCHFCPGVSSRQFITWLDDTQLARMHETEALGINYAFAALDRVSFQPDTDEAEFAGPVYLYVGLRGAWAPEGEPIGLSAIDARARPYKPLSQRDVQHLAAGRDDVEGTILHTVSDTAFRQARTQALTRNALPFKAPGLRFLKGGGAA